MTTTAQDTNGLVLTMVQPVRELLESSDAMKAIEKGVNAFMEDIPWLMKGLDEIARIHPVVTGTFGSSSRRGSHGDDPKLVNKHSVCA